MLGGVRESMSRGPDGLGGARGGLRLGPPLPLEDTLWEALGDSRCGLSMAGTAEKLAERFQLSRWARAPVKTLSERLKWVLLEQPYTWNESPAAEPAKTVTPGPAAAAEGAGSTGRADLNK